MQKNQSRPITTCPVVTFPLEDCVCVLLINTSLEDDGSLRCDTPLGRGWDRVKLQGLAGIAQYKSDCIADMKTWVQISNTHLKTLGLAMHIPLIIACSGVETGESLGLAAYRDNFCLNRENMTPDAHARVHAPACVCMSRHRLQLPFWYTWCACQALENCSSNSWPD